MIFPKGGVDTEDTILFGKYRICRIIGQGRSGTVFLTRHLALGEYRAVKRVRKDGRGEESFLREAMILKSLRHPGIPVIYDLEQDTFFYYLIEEYLDGESLFALISAQGSLSRAKTISYGITLCQIMQYLHSFKPNPILYLDLQPKNLMICDGALKLIDFDQAVSAIFTGDPKKRYGTVGCAAPEQFTNEPLDVRTDIYAIGALLYYMGTGTFPDTGLTVFEDRPEDALRAVIKQCLRPSKDDRYADVKSVLEELMKLKPGVFAENQISLLKIAVVCSNHGMGATHASIGLSSYLSEKGINSLYMECSASGAAAGLAAYYGASPDRCGIFRVRGLEIKPQYGACVKLELPPYDVYIEDWGANSEAIAAEDSYGLILLLCGGKWWEIYDSVRAVRLLAQKENLRVVFNHLSPATKANLPEDLKGFSCHEMPLCPDPEQTDVRTERFWTEILTGTRAGQFLSEPGTGRRFRKGVVSLCKKVRRFLNTRKRQ